LDPDPLARLGWDAGRAAELELLGDPSLEPARVVRVDRGLATVAAGDGDHRLPWATADDPAVGDFVAFRPGERIAAVLERRTLLARRAGERGDERQVAAANVDRILVVRALDTALRLNRVLALVTMAWESGAEPLVVLTKADCADDPATAVAAVGAVVPGVAVHAISSTDGRGVEAVRAAVAGRTVVLLGESGAGKSTLVNLLVGRPVLETGAVRRDGQGRHTTTHRELVPLADGGAVIDTPGVREAGYWGDGEGIALAFAEVEELAAACRFVDCAHRTEPGCAIRAALDGGTLHPERLEAYHHARREQAWLAQRDDKRSASVARAERRRLGKARRRDAW
jgi:ribosome biogenesis GTPase